VRFHWFLYTKDIWSCVGIIKSVDATQRTTIVRWLQQVEKLNNPQKKSFQEENVSVYEVVEHPHFNYRLGDVVVRLTMEQPKVESNKLGKLSTSYLDKRF
jgi:hypothetical protein